MVKYYKWVSLVLALYSSSYLWQTDWPRHCSPSSVCDGLTESVCDGLTDLGTVIPHLSVTDWLTWARPPTVRDWLTDLGTSPICLCLTDWPGHVPQLSVTDWLTWARPTSVCVWLTWARPPTVCDWLTDLGTSSICLWLTDWPGHVPHLSVSDWLTWARPPTVCDWLTDLGTSSICLWLTDWPGHCRPATVCDWVVDLGTVFPPTPLFGTDWLTDRTPQPPPSVCDWLTWASYSAARASCWELSRRMVVKKKSRMVLIRWSPTAASVAAALIASFRSTSWPSKSGRDNYSIVDVVGYVHRRG